MQGGNARRGLIVGVLVLTLSSVPRPVLSQGLSLGASLELLICVGAEREFFSLGGGGALTAAYPLSLAERLSLGLGGQLGYTFLPVTSEAAAATYSTSTIFVGADGRLSYRVAPILSVFVGMGLGGYFTLLHEQPAEHSFHAFVQGEVGVGFDVCPSLQVSLAAGYRRLFGYYGGVVVSAGTTLQLPEPQPPTARGSERRGTEPLGEERLETAIEVIELGDVYPVLHTRY